MNDAAKSEDATTIDRDLQDLLRDQQERQTRMRHVQEFLTTPAFLDLADMSLEVSDDPETLQERRRDLDYRIKVMRAILKLMEDERSALDRVESVQEPASPSDR
ncbi:hypothetical protein FIU97_15510 [Roseivivax sp. THAF40]|uniref:hypothetical protein n=1 Tax=unclassified Roseivivax TaxID=2639302 RepID=UPI001268D2C0|nr:MULTISPECIES: hypothetical protein [unclassified Roseivivax]QFS84160.1 hypothetical protein FIV09_15095 [Roseivivax sp. THAF197b]QFT47988.1 hypothetical protein FIU97_15510 [Roseivivax sp. THAF40]